MDLKTIVKIAKAYDGLGWQVQDHLDIVLADPADMDKVSPGRLALARDWLDDVASDLNVEGDVWILVGQIDEFLETPGNS